MKQIENSLDVRFEVDERFCQLHLVLSRLEAMSFLRLPVQPLMAMQLSLGQPCQKA